MKLDDFILDEKKFEIIEKQATTIKIRFMMKKILLCVMCSFGLTDLMAQSMEPAPRDRQELLDQAQAAVAGQNMHLRNAAAKVLVRLEEA